MTGYAIHFQINFDDTDFNHCKFENKKAAQETGATLVISEK